MQLYEQLNDGNIGFILKISEKYIQIGHPLIVKSSSKHQLHIHRYNSFITKIRRNEIKFSHCFLTFGIKITEKQFLYFLLTSGHFFNFYQRDI